MSDDDADYLDKRIAPLKLKHRAQPFIDQALQPRRKCTGMLGQETEIEGVCLDRKHRPPVSRLGAARFGKICPTDLPSPNLAHLYQASIRETSIGRDAIEIPLSQDFANTRRSGVL
jgi:hypothetical protein